MITDENRRAAERQMQNDPGGHPKAVGAHYNRRSARILIDLESGLQLAFPPHLAQGLEHAAPPELTNIEITPLC